LGIIRGSGVPRFRSSEVLIIRVPEFRNWNRGTRIVRTTGTSELRNPGTTEIVK
jgi:hypothetical protein